MNVDYREMYKVAIDCCKFDFVLKKTEWNYNTNAF